VSNTPPCSTCQISYSYKKKRDLGKTKNQASLSI
jgi:hypothetical protein